MSDTASPEEVVSTAPRPETFQTPVPRGKMYIAGLGTALPPCSIQQDAAAKMATGLRDYDADQKRRIEKLYGLTRVAQRHCVVLDHNGSGETEQQFFEPANGTGGLGPRLSRRMERYEEAAPQLALEAARKAMQAGDIAPESITHLITVSCSGFTAPGVDVFLIRHLGLPATTQRTHVGFMGCHGAMNAVRVAHGYLGNMPAARVLVVAVELCSLHYQYSTDDETNLANGLFSDGAAALVATGDVPERGPRWQCVDSGSCILPDSEAAMTWKIRDHGFQMTLSREVPIAIKAHLLPWMTTWLARNGLTVEEVASWAVHPGGPAILQGVQSALSLKHDDLKASWNVLRDCGNMSSPTVLFVMDAMRRASAPMPCVALGFGPGLAAEATLWR